MKTMGFVFIVLMFGSICVAQTGVLSTAVYSGPTTFPEDPNLNADWDWEQGDILQGGHPRYWIFLQNKPNPSDEYCALPPWRQDGSWSGLEDRKKEDGWKILARDFGSPERRLIGKNPYFVLYNPNRSVIRVFILMLDNNVLKNFSYATIELFGYHDDAGTLAHLAPVAYAMDKVDQMYNNATSEVAPSGLLLPNFWVYGDFPLGHDTNLSPDDDTQIPSSLRFIVKGIEVTNVDLKIDGFGAQGNKKFIQDFIAKNNFGSPSFSLDKLNMPQLGDFSLSGVNLKATAPDWEAMKKLFSNINIDMNLGSIDASNPFKGLFDGFATTLSGLSAASPLSISGLDLGGLFKFFVGGGMKQNNIVQTAPTFISMNYLATGTMTSSNPVAILTIPIPAARRNYKAAYNGGEIGIICNEPVGILTLTNTPVVYKKSYFFDQEIPDDPGRRHQIVHMNELELSEVPQIELNDDSNLELKKCEICLSAPVKYTIQQWDQYLGVCKVFSYAANPTQQALIELESPINEYSGNFRSLPVPVQMCKGRTLQVPQTAWSGVYLKVRAVLQRKDDPNTQPIIFNATYNVDVVNNGGACLQPLALIPPQEVSAVLSSNQVSISWSANLEKSVTTGGGYNIYRDIYYGGITLSTEKLNSSLLTVTTFTDYKTASNFFIPAGIPSGVDLYFRYRVEAVSNDGTVSTKSDPADIYIGRTITGTVSSGITTTSKMLAFGNITVNSTLTFPVATTLLIREGTTIKLASGVSIYSYGKLTAVGILKSKITFTSTGSTTAGSWGNIYLSGSGANGSSITFANIEYGTEVDVINASNVIISDCSILNSSSHGVNFSGSTATSCKALHNSIMSSNNYHGIVVNNGANVQCDQNTLKKTNQSGAGIYFLNGSSGTIFQNDIRGWNYGVGCYNGSSPQFRNNPPVYQNRNNRITECLRGVYAVTNSFPVIGEPVPGWGINSIYNNTKNNIYFDPGSARTLDAVATYWATTNPQATFYLGSGCSIYTNLMLTTNPWGAIPLPKSSGEMITEQPGSLSGENPNAISTLNTQDSIFIGISLRQEKGKKAAKDFFKSYLTKRPDDQAAYVELYNCADNETAEEIIQFFSRLPVKAAKEQELLLPYLYLGKGDIASAKSVNDRIYTKNKNKEIGARAILSNFYIALYTENDIEKAFKLFNAVASNQKLISPDELELAKSALETYPGISDDQRIKLKKQTMADLAVPDRYELFQNYPNPFNPITTINYQIPKDGFVTLKVYDILGREVITLVNEYKTIGRYTATFDASKLSSGLYIYRFVSQPVDGGRNDIYTAVKKMLLLK